MRPSILLLTAATLCSATAAAAPAFPTVERIRADGVLQCGSAIRPGIAFPGPDHVLQGLAVDFCRAIASAVLEAEAKIDFHAYVLRTDFERARGADAVSFLTGSEFAANDLYGRVLPGPAVFFESTGVMVWDTSPIRHAADLSGQMICAEPGTGAERNLIRYAKAHALAIHFSAWQEIEEMMDAFAVGRCPAVAGEQTALAALGLATAAGGHAVRLLPEPLSVSPLLASAPLGDASWSAVVSWTVAALLAAPGDAETVPGAEWGLTAGWQARAVGAVGGYAAIYRRSLGADSPLRLRNGINADWRDGGLLTAPAAE